MLSAAPGRPGGSRNIASLRYFPRSHCHLGRDVRMRVIAFEKEIIAAEGKKIVCNVSGHLLLQRSPLGYECTD
jgi:hypothetical protein